MSLDRVASKFLLSAGHPLFWPGSLKRIHPEALTSVDTNCGVDLKRARREDNFGKMNLVLAPSIDTSAHCHP